jgi:branched-chain amino acid aminotransferase
MCTTDGYLAEGTGENLFLVRGTTLVTPPLSATGSLAGITADAVSQIARDLGFEVREELVRRPDLYLADEAFLTGTAAEVVPIASADDRTIGDGRPGPTTKAIQEVFFATVRGEVERYRAWLDRV